MKNHFLLDPNIVFLNHGSFGATPRPVMDAYQEWQYRFERQPVQFISRDLLPGLKRARQALAGYLNADADNLVYIPNTTFGVNIVARSIQLRPGDEVLSTDHIYGACENVWNFIGQKKGSKLVKRHVPLPLASPEEIIELFWQGVTPKTRVIFISHITSPTAVHFPVEEICRKAREEGILTIVDGAHTPGQIPLDLKAIEPDFYLGNCHKWLMSPKGSAFLYTRKDLQPILEPLIVSWGWGDNASFTSGSRYLDIFEWLGTNDLSAYLSVPDAIRFQEAHNWPKVRQECRQLLAYGLQLISELTGIDAVYSDKSAPFAQMATARLPRLRKLTDFKDALLQKYRVEIPCTEWDNQHFIRISIQGYNTRDDVEALCAAIGELLPIHKV